MVKTARRLLNDSPVARWTALILVSSMMFFAYMFIDVLSPLQDMLLQDKGWSAETYGIFGGSEYFLNVFFFFLIFAGIILDKMGVRFTGILSAFMMILGASIKLYALTDSFADGGFGYSFLDSFWHAIPASAKMASIGFAVFGAGVEMAGITVSRIIVKWFTGKELALAMGIEMAIARLGVFAVFRLSPRLYAALGSLAMPVAICGLLLCVGLVSFIVFAIMDRKFDEQRAEADELAGIEESEEDQFKVSDIGKLLTSKPFMLIALLCVIYYSAIFPFQKFATSMLSNTLSISTDTAADIFSWFPIGAMALTPILGAFLDFRGRGATMLIIGAVLMFSCHMTLALAPMTQTIAYIAIVILGISFSLVPAALWPSVPKLVESRYLGSAYGLIFWIQNIGLLAFPIIIGWALDASNPEVAEYVKMRDIQAKELAMAEANGEKALDDKTLDMSDEFVASEGVVEQSTKGDFEEAVDGNIDAVVEDFADAVEATEETAIAAVEGVVEDIEESVRGEKVVEAAVVEVEAIEGVVDADGRILYDYTVPMLIFASLGVLAFIFGLWLKREDAKHGYGLEQPNVKRD